MLPNHSFYTKMAKKETVKKSASKKSSAKKSNSSLLAEAVVKGIQEKKGKNITCLNLQTVRNAVCDYFIICEGDSRTQVDAIADSVEEQVKKTMSEKPYHTEGYENSEWILMDYFNVVVHIFQPETRRFYNLESLWADAEVQELASKN